jgi:hypothetical protein
VIGAPDSAIGRRAAKSGFLALGLIFAGFASLFSSPYLSSYSHSITTTSVNSGQQFVNINFVYPLQAYVPLVNIAGLLMIVSGLWYSRRLLATNVYVLDGMAWVTMGFLPFLLSAGFSAVLSFLPESAFFAQGTQYTITPLYLATLLIIGLQALGPSILGVWITMKLFPVRRRMIVTIFGVGAVLTFLSLLSVQYTAWTGLDGTLYQRGFPIGWLALPYGFLSVPPGWYPTGPFILDFLFWSGCILLAYLAAIRLLRRRTEPSRLTAPLSDSHRKSTDS